MHSLTCCVRFCLSLHSPQQAAAEGSSKAAQKALQAEKMELRNSLVSRLQHELFTGAEMLQGTGDFTAAAQAAATGMLGAHDAVVSSSTVTVWTTPVILVNASACYQATYR